MLILEACTVKTSHIETGQLSALAKEEVSVFEAGQISVGGTAQMCAAETRHPPPCLQARKGVRFSWLCG